MSDAELKEKIQAAAPGQDRLCGGFSIGQDLALRAPAWENCLTN